MDALLLSRLPALLDRLKPGVLWVSHLGLVHHSNAESMCCTGVRTGDRLPAGDLLRAVVEAVHHRVPRRAVLTGRPALAGDLEPQMTCQVLPGLSDEDALVLLGEPAHATGLDTELLMQLVADDLRHPVHQAQLALSVCAHQGDAQGVAALVDEVEALLHSLDRLIELATLWPGMAAAAQDRLDPGHLLRQAWSDVADLARTRAIQVGFGQPPAGTVLAPLYGHGPGLRRVLRNCLRAALHATAPGGRLRVDYRQAGTRAQVVFVDCAMFAGLPAGHRPAGIGQRRSHEQLDWHLCRRILALHGAQLREERDGVARNFMIDLPCGAPFPIDNSGIAIEQAHRYAHDLSALLARNRRLSAERLPPASQGAGLPA
ncbi:MAG: histidine kinase [Burkholderiales bacterium PBB5]|nr:MAG: histidine kinase [Burkholderiales bacterium PBB5]